MSVGYSVGKGDLDLTLGIIATGTRDLLNQALQVVSFLTNQTDQQIQNMGYTPADVTLIRAVQADVTLLAQIIQGQTAQTAAHDFTANLKQLYGMH